ncbi:MAG: hypothetical protein ABIK79_00075 [Chloroflexota bacterium]
MKKLLFAGLVLVLLVAAMPVLAGPGRGGPPDPGPPVPPDPPRGPGNGRAGKSNVGHLYLYEKDPSDWSIVEGGAWGKMIYSLSGPEFAFVFNGHRLDPDTEYSLIYYADLWPGNHPGALIASGTTCIEGNINLVDCVDLGMDLPDPADANYPDGAKIWLVLSDDYDGSKMTAWNPEEYLFEYDLITYDDTDVPVP